MLIVIVIIGILAAALIPRLSSARGRANDVARKADLAQVAAALVSYQIDHGRFPECPTSTEWCNLSDIEDELIWAGMSSIPTDPDASRTIDAGIDGLTSQEWEYAYIPITKWSIANNWFVVMAATETEWWSNFIGTNSDITVDSEYDDIASDMCKEFTDGSATCENDPNQDDLRYIYLY